MMHRRGGKRIRMDDPVPPEYDTPMTPMTPSNDNTADANESYSSYTSYNNVPQTPVHNPTPEHYSSESYSSPGTSQQQYQEQSNNFDNQVQFEQPMTPATPANMRITRNTRARLRGNSVQQPKYKEIDTDFIPTTTSRGRGGGRGRGRRLHHSHSLEDEASLYYVIRNNRSSLTTIVDDWIEKYKSNRENALLMLMQFFINASGCKGRITSEMQATMEHVAIIRKMTEEFDEESGEYPLIMTGQQWKKFRANFCEFVQILVRQCQYSIIYDQFLMDNVISLLTGLSDSQVRAFRHTATLAAMKLMTALVDVALTVSINLDNTQRQYEAERQKAREKRAADRLESLMAKRKELEENMDEIKNMLTYMFKSVFVHRYRDTLPEIRAICMAEIGVWMKKFHQNFLDDSYLKYIGWTLHDKVGEVRLKCLQALQPLYASEELKTKLELFTSKFKDRIVAMTLDKEYDVAVQAVKLVISILKHHREILTDKDCEHVYELVYSSHRAVAQAAGEFLNERLFRPDDEAIAGVKTKRGKKRLPNTPLIRDLVLFFIESELHEHGAYLVDSLIETNQMMKDWECMTDLLLEEAGPEEEALDNQKETSLIELMVCCIKQAATGEAPVGRGPTRKILSVKELKQVHDDKQRLTEHFIQTLPHLLDKYRADPEKLANLLAIPQYFDLDIYTKSRQEQNLDSLLTKIHTIVEKIHDTEVLDTASKTLENMCVDGHAIFTRCDVARSTLIDFIVNKYKEAIDEYRNLIEGDEEPDEDEIFNVVQSLKKVSIFYSSHNMNPWGIWDSLYKDIKDAKDPSKCLPHEAVKYCISACFFAILWGQHHLMEATDSGSRGEDECRQLKERLHSFMASMRYFVSGDNSTVRTPPILREEAYNTICDLLVVFCNQLASHPNALMSQLVYEPDQTMQHMLNRFIQEYVFCEEEDDEHDEHSKIEELHKRRNFLASYCKLIVYNMIPTKAAADVFKHYVKYYNDYGDIIKTTLGKARDINKTNCALTMQHSLNILYNEIVMEKGKVNRNSEEFIAIKELAKRFALSFGLDAVKNREAITALHRAGVLFAITPPDGIEQDPTGPPPNLSFLEILSEFTNKLLKQDKRVVLNFLDRRLQAGMPSSRGEDWQPLLLYRNSLLHGETDQVPVTSKRAYTRRKKDHLAEEEDADEADEGSDHEFSGKHKKKRGPRKNQLPVTKISITRGPKSNTYYEATESGLIQTSPGSMAEDTSTSPSQDIDTRLKTLQIQSRPRRNQEHSEPRELRRTSRNSGRYIEGQYMESDSE
ncbi:PREDICTED: cohesin subunit SA-2 isoform X1 [Polistes dominula]|uniref:Cohesin subunit SA-2 isoform X1 n=1 Tax=Polistes dominula TaxID=743375 RepID=A0ABM1HUT6_POLDO|nr:PREDICTED: cohesin subunit SA-2 isoform X1 [Polistes dominula]XP_015171723.1 PREDICTED: cohesin subunit SA-2 isoform X1 [Polistes dominula]XP_015171724.1 PREDICTED: cohesin subunit SA-2 isoform X1 [Polistes dominula]